MGQKKKEGGGVWKNSGEQTHSSARNNAYIPSDCYGRTCAYADVVLNKNSYFMKGERNVKKQKRNGNGSGGNFNRSCNNLGANIQNPDNAIRKHGFLGLECLNNKQGNEIVEAAIVLPVFILIIVTLLSIAVFHFTSFRNDCLTLKSFIRVSFRFVAR